MKSDELKGVQDVDGEAVGGGESVNGGENGYGNILKRLSAFGGVQVFNILLGLVRGKFVAMILGPAGMGISSLLASSTNTIQQFSSLGLHLAVVKEVAAHKGDVGRLSHILAAVMRMIMLTSLLGGIVCALMSPLLSRWSFGTYDYTLWFVALSVSVMLSIGGAGYLALLQGAGEVKRLSKASLVGGSTGLLCGVPMYYLFGNRGIVPAMIVLALAMFLFYYLSYRRSAVATAASFSWREHRGIVRRLVSLGIVLMMSALVTTAVNYVINIFVRSWGSVDNVGLFQAANSITNQYVGVVFSALALDYFPRLSAVGDDVAMFRRVVNRQTEVVMLVVTPLVVGLIATAPWIIKLLLTDEFMSVAPLMRWMGVGAFIQAMAFPLEYIFIARDDKKVFVWLEVVLSNVVWLGASMWLYYVYGLTGLGVSVVVRWLFDLTMDILVCRRRYGMRYSRSVMVINVLSVTVVLCAFILSMVDIGVVGDVVMLMLFVLSVIYSVVLLRRKVRS